MWRNERAGRIVCGCLLAASMASSTAADAFSPAIRAAGTIWGQMSLNYFLAEPSGFIPGTTMAASPMQNPQARADVIGYLKSSIR
jgi:cytochrome c